MTNGSTRDLKSSGTESRASLEARRERTMKYKSVIVTRFGGPEVFRVIENDLRAPAAGEVRIRVLAAPVCRPDVTARQGVSLYHGTPLGQKLPFTPGYAVIGTVDAVGPGVSEVRVG